MSAKGGPRATVGVEDGHAYLLPEPEEDPEYWRNRARQAWVHAPDFALESLRMVDIARAQRLETLYVLLDGDGVHFRFNPGDVPKAPETPAGFSQGESGVAPSGPRRDAVYVEPFPIEGLLLEYARLKDEGAATGRWQSIPEHLVLCTLDQAPPGTSFEAFFEHCDGDTNIRELADRLGWTLRQVQITAEQLFRRDLVRAAAPIELLRLAHAELVETNCERAASRLVSWIECSPPGLLEPEDAGILAQEWEAERLSPALSRMPLPSARRLVQRLSRTIAQPLRTVEHWAELSRIAQHDTLVDLHLLVAQIRAAVDPNVPSFKSLLEVARGFTEIGHPGRGAAILRVAAGRQPVQTDERLQLGTAMLAARQPSEAVPWIIAACSTLLDEGKPERAVEPLRQLVELVPGDRETRRLLTRARAFSVRRALVKKNSLATMAVLMALSVGAVVQYRNAHVRSTRVAEVEAHLDDPNTALSLFESYFGDDDSARIKVLRETILDRKRDHDNSVRTAWTDKYREAQLECTLGDAVVGLQRALDVPPPPRDVTSNDPWPLTTDLFNGLAARVQQSVRDCGEKIEVNVVQEQAEQRALALIKDMQAKLEGRELSAAAKEFSGHLIEIAERIQKRGEDRAVLRKQIENKNLSNKQNMLLGAARAYKSAGDYDRARQAYDSLIETDTSHKLAALLEHEMAETNTCLQALRDARALCEQGKHAEARALLQRALPRPGDYLLPWKVSSSPAGAKVRLPDGSVRETPFTVETTLFESVELAFEAPGYESRRVTISQPADQIVYLSRSAEENWKPGGRIDALPLTVGGDHLVADRNGNLTRLPADGKGGWTLKLETLGGFARSPVALPARPGSLLVVSEDGEAWIVDAEKGTAEGPWNRNVAPLAGPYLVGSDVLVRFRDSTVWRWSTSTAPDPVPEEEAKSLLARFEAESSDSEARLGAASNFATLRRTSAEGNHLDSPWNDLTLEIADGRCRLGKRGGSAPVFYVEIVGDWVYAAFESPSGTAPRGRLWISDGKGLRSFAP
ncbi:MAG: tetratricopeptide repeat protein [Planctomycetes bacterium]|nr:tetratricopeptide repeat protein [Planctomycetota bacterium]